MPSSSKSAGFSSRGLISTKLDIAVLTGGRGGAYPSPEVGPNERRRHMAFTVPPLPYDFDALEPHIDAKTMEIHHDKHHQAYVDNANKALEGTDWADASVEDVLLNLDSLPEDKRGPVRN